MHLSRKKLYREAKKVTIISGILNLLLMVYKLIIGYISNSSVVIADGIHSLSDLLTDIIVLIGVKLSIKPEDENHPYGHGKVETFASLIIAVALILVALGIVYTSLRNIFFDRELGPVKMIALTAVLLSIIIKELLFRYTITIGRKYNLSSLIANAWHHRSDVYSSIAAMAGVIGAMMGIRILDPIFASVVALLIGKVGVDIGRDAFMELIDTSADKKVRDKIIRIINDTKGVKSYHGLKTREVGNRVISELQIKVDPAISVVEGHDIAKDLKSKIKETISEVENILIHVEPVGDVNGITYATARNGINEPRIKIILRKIKGVKGVHSLKIHHFGNHIVLNVDVEVDPASTVQDGHNIAKEAKRALFKLSDCVEDVVIHIDPYESGSED